MSNEQNAAKEFTKRPVKISARKWQKDGDHDQVTSLPGELWGDTHAERYCKCCGMNKCNHGTIKTLEGGHIVCPGDWIIKGVKGEHYPCKPDIFEMTYAPAQSAPAGWPTDDMVVRGAEELHDSLRMFGIDINFDTKTTGTEIQQEIVEAVFKAMTAAAPKAEPQPVSDDEITKLLSCVRYLTGIAERGMKRPIREYESVESFVLKYVQSLEAQLIDNAAVSNATCRKLLFAFGLDCNAIGLTGAAENLFRGMKEATAAAMEGSKGDD